MPSDGGPREGQVPASRWDPHDDPTQLLFRRFRRLAVPFNALMVLVGAGLWMVTLLWADRVGVLVVGGVLWLGGACAGAADLLRRFRGEERVRIPPGLQGAELVEAKQHALGAMWKGLRVAALFLLALSVTYALAAGVDGTRRDPFLISAAIVAGLAMVVVVGAIGARRKHVNGPTWS